MVLIVILVLGIAVLAHTAPFPFIFDYAKSGISVWRMPESADRKIVFLTFDDGPNPTATPGLLDLLKEKKVHATFFLIDKYVNQETAPIIDRKSTRLNSSHLGISYAVFCLKKKKV